MDQPFSLDGTSPLLPFSGRFILMLDISMIVSMPVQDFMKYCE